MPDFTWTYLDGDGDFRSPEVTALRDESDFIITNPPFSLFREFLAWIMEGEKKFAVISSINAVTYKEVFPLIKENKMWSGSSKWESKTFQTPDNNDKAETAEDGKKYIKLGNTCWLTNIEHGRRHQPLVLMTMEENLRHSKHKEIIENGYPHYDNYDVIEVPFVDSIPSDYEGVMGVPISFLDKYCTEQFEIIGEANSARYLGDYEVYTIINGRKIYNRILIKKL